MTVRVHHGDSREVLKNMDDESVDSVVCDPPYALVSIGKRFGAADAAPVRPGATGAYARASGGFMGQTWDTGETAFDPEFWAEILRVLKPGGHLIAFSGTRTYHRLACAVEDAGFEVRDMIAWLYGSGFPKSHDVSKRIAKSLPGQRGASRQKTAKAVAEWQGWGTALKPALEPIVLARKPLSGTVTANVLAHGTGAINIDASRVGTGGGGVRVGEASSHRRHTHQGITNFVASPGPRGGEAKGRWPANVVTDGSGEVIDAFPVTASGAMKAGTRRAAQDVPGSVCYGTYGGEATKTDTNGDKGSAARFFYSAKANAADRCGSKHPTVKPIDLMAYLCRLVTPKGGLVLDPFAGSGTTGEACVREGFDCILIERESTYVADINRRLACLPRGLAGMRGARS